MRRIAAVSTTIACGQITGAESLPREATSGAGERYVRNIVEVLAEKCKLKAKLTDACTSKS